MRDEPQRILVLSGSTLPRLPTILNHRIYADRHGYRYRFDVSPHRDVKNLFFHKLEIIADALLDCDWLFWLDDDAAFMQLDRSLEDLVPEMRSDPWPWAIFCKSPINNGLWTLLSSGNFLIRNCPEAHAMLAQWMATDLKMVEAWWEPERHGLFTNGDQDAIVYHHMTNAERATGCLILEYERFNTRPFHFEAVDQHFLIHFTHRSDRSKGEQMTDFAQRFGLTSWLVPQDQIEPYQAYLPHLRTLLGAA